MLKNTGVDLFQFPLFNVLTFLRSHSYRFLLPPLLRLSCLRITYEALFSEDRIGFDCLFVCFCIYLRHSDLSLGLLNWGEDSRKELNSLRKVKRKESYLKFSLSFFHEGNLTIKRTFALMKYYLY